MKKTLSMIALTVLSVGLLGSCSKINERLDNLEKKVDGIENEQIASINTQITNINSSIADLGQIRSDITSLKQSAENHGEDIFDLQEADEALGDRIDNLEDYLDVTLPKFAEKDWVIATFSTLEQYEATCDTIAKIDARIGALDAKLSNDIKACADSLTKWVNRTFEGYYTAAQMDAKLAQMKAAIDSARAADKNTDAKADSIAAELAKVQPAVDSAKANIRKEYRAAIESAIKTSEGKLTKEITDKITAVNTAVTNLTKRVDKIEREVNDLTDRVRALEGMIQSVTIVPAYSDGSVDAKDGLLCLDIIVAPALAVKGLTEDSFKVFVHKANEAQTKVVSVDTVSITNFKADTARGTITARADISSKLPVESGKALTVAVNVRNGLSDHNTKFYPVTLSTSVTVSDDPTADTTKVTMTADADFPVASGILPVESAFDSTKTTTIEVEGIGTITFDENATKSITKNAEEAGAEKVSFKVEDVTGQAKVPENIDVVLQVTMKAVDEKGTEVYKEGVAGGEVTITIPIGEDVKYVNSVTLVNDKGEPIKGGVVPDSEVVKDGYLTFKVNHFSKYAVDYVKKKDFVDVTGVSLDRTSATLPVGDSITLTATVAPDNATNKKVTWSSDNPSVATVDKDGKVKAVADGTATITVTTEDGSKTATCTVTVVIGVTGVTLNKTELTLAVGGEETLTATVNPTNATNKKKTWSSDTPSVATVDNDGKVKAIAHGTATITVTTEDGSKTAACTVTVVIGVTGVSLDRTSATLPVGDSVTLTATVAPDNATNKKVTWSSDKEDVATVDKDGKVKAVAAGTATITVTTEDGSKTATCTVTVTSKAGTDPYGHENW